MSKIKIVKPKKKKIRIPLPKQTNKVIESKTTYSRKEKHRDTQRYIE